MIESHLIPPRLDRRKGRRRGSLPRFLSILALVFRSVSGLVVDHPCCSNMLHVPAAFGPDLLSLDVPIKACNLVVVEPEDACQELKTEDLRGKIALIKRGDCNFTDKIFRVQQKHAIAAVVYDSQDRERWGTIMSGVEEWVSRITIPSVFISHATGLALRNTSIATGGGVLVSLNDTGHVKPKTKQIGPIETLATYVVVSLVLLSFSGCCGLLLALCVTCYQRAFRQRALRGLKVQTYKRPPPSAASDSSLMGGRRLGGNRGAIRRMPGAAAAAAVGVRAPTVGENGGGGRKSVHRLFGGWDLFGSSSVNNSDSSAVADASTAAAAGSVECSNSNSSDSLIDKTAAAAAAAGGGSGGMALAAEGAIGEGGNCSNGGSKGTSSRNSCSLTPLRESWEDEDRTLCAICLDDYEDGDTLRLLPCGHSFHDVCIKPWLMEKSEACPMCKRPAFRSASIGGAAASETGTGGGGAAGGNRSGAALDAAALDEVFIFLMNNLSFFAMVLVAVLTSMTVLGAIAILRPSS